MISYIRRRYVAVLLLVFIILFGLYKFRWIDRYADSGLGFKKGSTKVTLENFRLRSATNDFDNVNSTMSTECTRMAPLGKVSTKPIWVASYPGSGAELFRELITGITGQPTVDGSLKGVCHNAITCKTHWPTMYQAAYQNPSYSSRRFHSSAILLIRNPSKAIPSWYNQMYETTNNLTFHSKQAPESQWNAYSRRFHVIDQRLEEWKQLILYWVNSETYNVTLFVPYEKMVHETEGPLLLQTVAKTLERANVRVMSPTMFDDIACLWNVTVLERASMKRENHVYVPSFTTRQKGIMLHMLDELMELARDRIDLLPILEAYWWDITNNLFIED